MSFSRMFWDRCIHFSEITDLKLRNLFGSHPHTIPAVSASGIPDSHPRGLMFFNVLKG